MSKLLVQIKGDTNDADFISSDTIIDPHKPRIITFNAITGFPLVTNEMALVEALSMVLKAPRRDGDTHNWSRDEYDDNSGKTETASTLIRALFDIDVNSEAEMDRLGEEQLEDLVDEMIVELSDNFLPYGEFGIHTIHEITIRPVEAAKVLYARAGYPRRREIIEEEKKADALIQIGYKALLTRFNHTEYFDEETIKWKKLHSIFLNGIIQAKVIWEK